MTIGVKKGVVAQKYADNGKKVFYWNESGANHIDIVASLGEQAIPFDVGYFDVRALGLYHRLAIDRQASLKQLFQQLQSTTIDTRIDRSDANIWAIHWVYDEKISTGQTVLSVDVRNGFTPIQFTMRERIALEDAPWVTTQEFRTAWKSINDVWVPIKHRYVQMDLGGQTRTEVEMNIVWEKVNQPIGDDVFHWKGFGAPETVGVVDSSLGSPVVVRPWVSHVESTWPMIVKIAISVAVGAAILTGILLYRRSRRLRS